MHRKRVKIYCKVISKLCFNCFGKHERKPCLAEKVSWIEYIKGFIW
jgi:hypothetical protein